MIVQSAGSVIIGGPFTGAVRMGRGRVIVNGVDVTAAVAAAAPEPVRLAVTLPAGSAVAAEVGAGMLTVRGELPAAEVTTTSADVDIDITEDARVRTVSGDITARTVASSAHLRSVSGDIGIDAAAGPVTAETTSGDITVHAAEPVTIDAASVSGDIRVTAGPGVCPERAGTLGLRPGPHRHRRGRAMTRLAMSAAEPPGVAGRADPGLPRRADRAVAGGRDRLPAGVRAGLRPRPRNRAPGPRAGPLQPGWVRDKRVAARRRRAPATTGRGGNSAPRSRASRRPGGRADLGGGRGGRADRHRPRPRHAAPVPHPLRPRRGRSPCRDGRPYTHFGAQLPRRHLRDRWTGYGICHPSAVTALCGAWQVTVLDPQWGRNDRLWPVLRDALARRSRPGRPSFGGQRPGPAGHPARRTH